MVCKYCGKETEASNGFCEHCDAYIEKKKSERIEKENSETIISDSGVLKQEPIVAKARLTDHFGCALASTIMGICGLILSMILVAKGGVLFSFVAFLAVAAPLGVAGIRLASFSLVYASNNWHKDTKPIFARIFGIVGLVLSILLIHIGLSLVLSAFL